jgi:hypothetical protein
VIVRVHKEVISGRLLGQGDLDIVAGPIVVVTDGDFFLWIWGSVGCATAHYRSGCGATNESTQNRPAIAGCSQPPGQSIERASIHRRRFLHANLRRCAPTGPS